jgi:hypothetical protein
MKKISVFLALLALFFADAALARAVITTLTGTAQAQRGTAAPRPLRLGDEVVQGETVSTGANSSIVMKFDDGEVAALTSNSRMTITAYQYNEQAGTGSVLLSLITGGMRAVTGLIGRNSPERVTYRAASTTIGIRGTDVTIVTDAGQVVVTVVDGQISFKIGDGAAIPVSAGQGINSTQGRVDAADAIIAQVRLQNPGLADAISNLGVMTSAITNAAAGTSGTFNSSSTFIPSGTGSGSSGGGGTSSTGTPPASP